MKGGLRLIHNIWSAFNKKGKGCKCREREVEKWKQNWDEVFMDEVRRERKKRKRGKRKKSHKMFSDRKG
jgi:hypothetical protein